MDKHGGLAIGGAKFNKPSNNANKPKKKDGGVIIEGEWFEDHNGKKMRMVKNKHGEEEYEIEEEFVDEKGVKKKIIKKMKFKTDPNGNLLTQEEFIDHKTGQKMKIDKKTYKDKDGIEVFEEIITNANGEK